ncbi:hypothetical protein IKQ21_07320, partial [bacterium]|nr:hypothetical protein [bacterium]
MRLLLTILVLFLILPNAFAFGKSDDASIKIQNIQQPETKYTFEEEDTLSGKVVKLEKGTTLPVTLQTPLDTSSAQKRDEVVATLDEDLEVDGAKIAEKGSILYGKITKAKSASRCMRGGKVTIDFDKMVTTENKTYNISAQEIEFKIQEDGFWLSAGRAVITIVAFAAYIFMTGGAGAVVV